MAEANFTFISDASGGDQFTVVSFNGNEAISTLYQYELEIKSPLSAATNLDELLDSPARFVTETNGQEHPVYGVLSSIDEIRTVQGYVYYQAVLVPKLWRLSIYKTNEIYCEKDQTVDEIIETVLESAGFISGTDYDLSGLDDRDFLKRDYRCQFGESDFDFISRLMENEGIFYYFDHGGDAEKIIFINDFNYLELPHPGLIFDVAAQTSQQHDSVNAWSCRKQRLASSVTIRDFNPDRPSLDISHTMPIDQMGQGTEYLYGDSIRDAEEAEYLSNIRAEEHLCQKTRYYGESSVARLQSGYLFGLGGHPNENYNGVEYLTVEVSHEGMHLDMSISGGRGLSKSKSKPQYRNSFVAIDASEQYRPARVTAKPRFYGTMTAFVYAEAGKTKAEIDECGRYRVHLPFDRSDGTLLSTDPHRKASTWIRMAQPYVGQEQGMYFPLTGGTEVLLTFINGDPDQPVITAALPNGSQPSLLTSEANFVQNVTTDVSFTMSGNTHTISQNSGGIYTNSSNISTNRGDIDANLLRLEALENPVPEPAPTLWGLRFINSSGSQSRADDDARAAANVSIASDFDHENPSHASDFANLAEAQSAAAEADIHSMFPPWSIPVNGLNYNAIERYESKLIKFKKYNDDFSVRDMEVSDLTFVDTERDGGDYYHYGNCRVFHYPQHERVYFIGTFHEDFHVKDDFATTNSWTGIKEVFSFPAPGTDFPPGTNGESTDNEVNPSGIRGVSEARFWGDQMNYAWGRSFNWAGGPPIPGAPAQNNPGSFAEYNYGNSYAENLLIATGGTSDDLPADKKSHADDYANEDEFKGDKLANASIEKTFGSTYSYQNGYSLDIKVGNSKSKTYGNSDDYTSGFSKEVVEGDKNEEIHGHSVAHWYGSSHEIRHGAVSEMFLGAKNEFAWSYENAIHGGAATEIYGAVTAGIFIGSALEAYIGLKQELTLAAVLEFSASVKIGAIAGADLTNEGVKADNTEVALKRVMAQLKNSNVCINQSFLELFG